jgi:glycolate oxidase
LGAVRIEAAKDAADRARLWTARKKSVGTLGRLTPSHCTQDGVVPRTKLPQILREIAAIGAKAPAPHRERFPCRGWKPASGRFVR